LVPRHESVVGNETADQLAKLGCECPFIEAEPAYGISVGVAKKTARDCKNRDHKKPWESSTGLKLAKGLIQGPSV
jgi:hypothetical protein